MCGCGNGGGSDSGVFHQPLLSGSLDSRYATGAAQAPPATETSDMGIASEDVTGGMFSGGFWVIVLFIVGAAWIADRAKKNNEG